MGDSSSEPILSRRTVEGLVELTRSLGMTSDLQDILDIICAAIVDVARFESAAINLVTESGDLQVVAVAGPPEVGDALLGTVGLREHWAATLAACVRHHGLHLDLSAPDSALETTWMSDDEAWFARHAGDPRAWRPEYALFVPMADSSGEMIGVVSVDLPRSGLIPDAAQAATVEIVARQAERAIASARLLARSELNERVYRMAFDTAPTLTVIAEAGGAFVDANAAFRDAFVAVPDAATFDRVVTVLDGDSGLSEAIDQVFSGGVSAASFVAEVDGASGPLWFRVTARGIGQTVAVPTRAICTIVDISVERREQMRHRRDAEHDPLTGLLNRRGARTAMDDLLARLEPGSVVAVLAGDLDEFKEVNDRHGHQVGDEVLRRAAARIRSSTPADRSVLVRLGGDEFLVVVACASRSAGETIADAIVRSMRAGVEVDGELVPVTISVGLAMAGADESHDLDGLADAADRALYEAKATGRSRWASAPQPVA